MKKRARAQATRLAPILQILLIALASYILLSGMLLIGITPEQHDIQIGAPASIDIMATKDVNDVVTTEAHREAAAAAVEPSYKSVDTSVVGEVNADIESRFNELLDLKEESSPEAAEVLTDAQFEQLIGTLSGAITRDQYSALVEQDPDVVRKLFNDTLSAVRETLNSTLPEGQESAAISRISRSLTASGYPAALVSLATDVMREYVRPNMLIDEEITEANRQKARDAVEMETCVKGEVIVRRGDIVTQAQYTMLSSLGLLKEDSLDIPLFAGIALIVLLIMACLGLYLYRFERERLNVKTVSLLCLIFVLVTGLSLGFSRWNTYMMPVSLGMMLIALLIDARLALYMNLGMGLIASLLTDASSGLFTVAMFSVVLMSMVNGPVILMAFSRRVQRTTTLLAGVLVGVSNFLVTLAVGLINSAELSLVLSNALWAMGSGIVSAVLCIGIQPLLEWLFNLATNSKLIELSNPNQPLLRRLLLEAPGTYHHSIIVANLAEAAATAVGANGLLARVGAYYHDVGKLKRPIYFKENQMGDNPHDRTDPRVSAAILTAHPRDGAAMAQKERIPEPVLDIIRQHHGDGIAIYFYDKAVKLYGADQVDITAFRYDGPRPRSKEAAVVMLADTIEAAARSIPDPDPEKIDALIRKLVRGKLNDGQLDESNLTFNDLEKICSAFSTVLTGVFHERIEYPDIALPPRTEKPAQEDAGAKPDAGKAGEAAAKPAETPTRPAEPAPARPAETAPKPADVPARPTEPAAKPVEQTARPTESAAKTADTGAKPVEPSPRPAESAPKPAEQPAKPAEPAAKPADSAVKPAEPSIKPAETAVKPAETAAKPAETPAKAIETSAKPAESPSKPAEPAASAAKPVGASPAPSGQTPRAGEAAPVRKAAEAPAHPTESAPANRPAPAAKSVEGHPVESAAERTTPPVRPVPAAKSPEGEGVSSSQKPAPLLSDGHSQTNHEREEI